MPDNLPLITPAQRQRLQKLWEEARGLMARAGSPPSRKEAEKIHELLAECVAGDPGNTVYLDALLVHLRTLRQIPKSPWWFLRLRFFGSQSDDFDMKPGPAEFLALLHGLTTVPDKSYPHVLQLLASACSIHDLSEAEVRYLREALHFIPEDGDTLTKLARSLMRQGRFDEARSAVERLGGTTSKSGEVAKLLVIMGSSPTRSAPQQEMPSSAKDFLALAAEHVHLGQFDEAEAAAAKALSLSGGDLTVREQVEDISLARLQNNVAIARRLVEYETSPAHQQTLHRWEEELGRLELATLNARSERFPQDAGLKLEVTIRLKRAGNYSGAIQRLEEIATDHSLRPSVLLELGECWQHLRQFEKALGLYSQAIAAAEELSQPEPLKLALYRAGSLATAMQQTSAARNWFERLVTLAPEFKDARARLGQLDT